MEKKEILELYDCELRKDIDYPGARKESLEHVTRFIWPLPAKSFIVYSDIDQSNADAVIDDQLAYFVREKLPFEWKVYSHDRPADLFERLESRGLEPDEWEAIMVLDLDEVPEQLQESVTADIRRLDNPDQLADVVKVLESVWGGNFDWVYRRIGDHMQVPGYISVYVGYAEGEPVAVAWTYFHEGHFASLWAGSTVESMRGQGFYKALLAARIQEAQARGKRFVTIDTGPMSQPIVTRLGFRELTNAASLEWKTQDSN